MRLVWSRSVDDPDVAGIHGVFGLEMAHCSNCGGDLKMIAAMLEQPVIEKILTHLGCKPERRLGRRFSAKPSLDILGSSLVNGHLSARAAPPTANPS